MRLTFRPGWRRVLKYAGIGAAVVLLVFGLTSWLLFQQRNTLVLEQVQSQLAQTQSGELTIGAIDLRLFRNFPDIGIALDSVRYFERHDSLRIPGERPIFQANNVFIALDLWSLLNNRVEVSGISVSRASVNLIEYKPGLFNIHQALSRPRKTDNRQSSPSKKPAPRPPSLSTPKQKVSPGQKTAPESAELAIDLENFMVQDLRLTWLKLGEEERNSLLIRNLEAELSQSSGLSAVAMTLRVYTDTVRIGNVSLPQGEIAFDAMGQFDSKTGILVIQETTLALDVLSLTASGSYEHQNRGKLDLQVKASSDDLPLLEKMLRQEIIRDNRDLLRSGDIYLQGRVFGDLQKQPPLFDINFGAKNLSFRLPGQKGEFRNLGFEGKLTSGPKPDYSSAAVQLSQIKGQVPGGYLNGEIRVSNLVFPWLQCNIHSQFTLDGFDKVFRIDRVQELEGTATARIRFDGPMRVPWPGSKGPKATFDADFSVSRLSFLLDSTHHRFQDITCRGNFTSGNKSDQSEAVLAIEELRAQVPGGTLTGNLRITNFLQPLLHYQLSAGVNLAGYDQAFQLGQIRDLRGKASADLRFDGPLALIGTHAMDSSRSNTLRLDSVSFRFSRSLKKVSGLQAILINRNNLAEVSLALQCDGSDLQLKASIENLMHRIFAGERIVQATGRLTSRQFRTRDVIFDTLKSPIVDDIARNLSMDFQLDNGLSREDSLMGNLDLAFDIKNLTASFEKLADIRGLSAKGTFRIKNHRVSLELLRFGLTLPQGRVDISGDMTIPAKRQLVAQAKIRFNDFPLAYASDLIAEIKEGTVPSRKNLPVGKMDRVTADLDVVAFLRTYPFDIQKVDIRNSRLQYRRADDKVFAAERISASFEPFSFLHPPASGAITGLNEVNGTCAIEGLSVPGLPGLHVELKVHGRQDTLEVIFNELSRKSKRSEGSFFADLSGPGAAVRLRYEVLSTPAETIVRRYSKKEFLSGDISYNLDLEASGSTWADARNNLKGTVEISSDSLVLRGIDIDDVLTKFEKSQNFNLADLGAVVLVGPVGIVATKGSDFVALASIDVTNKSQTFIDQLLARWTLDHQVLQTADVAFATRKNRIAFIGAIDFAHDSIPGVLVAVVDKNGCSLMDQRLHGKFTAIQKGKLKIAKTLLGSVTNFVDAIVGKDCAPIYTGKVKDPKSGSK